MEIRAKNLQKPETLRNYTRKNTNSSLQRMEKVSLRKLKRKIKSDQENNPKPPVPEKSPKFHDHQRASEIKLLYFSERVRNESKSEESSKPCNGSYFQFIWKMNERVDWELVEQHTNTSVANQTYRKSTFLSNSAFEECINPGHYKMSIYNEKDYFSCESGLSCYNVIIDGKDITQNSMQPSQYGVHIFDSSKLCIVNSYFEIKYHNESNLYWTLLSDFSNMPLYLEPVPGIIGGSTVSYYACIPPGLYTIDIYDAFKEGKTSCGHSSACYSISINNTTFINGNKIFEEARHVFFLRLDGAFREQHCQKKPILSSTNKITNFKYDDRIGKLLDIIHALSSPDALNDFESIQYRAACWILYDDPTVVSPDNRRLIDMYISAILGFAANLSHEVMHSMLMCSDKKISCNKEGHLSRIEFELSGMKGTIPTELSFLRHLEHLDLSSNHLVGTIPLRLGVLSRLKELDLSSNILSGTVPTDLGNLRNLVALRLGANQLEGSIPTELGQCLKLEKLYLNDNDFQSTIPLEIFESTQLEHLVLSSNKLTGTFPSHIFQLQQLEILRLNENELFGKIPSEIGFLSFLSECNLGKNALVGALPREMENLDSLSSLYLNDNVLTGTIPDIFGNLNELYWIDMRNNSLSGFIPNSIWELEYDDDFGNGALDLQDNNLNGNVPINFCDKLSFQGWDKGVKIFKVDDSSWFLNEASVNCTCCDIDKCYMWDHKKKSVGGTVRPTCPESNVLHFEFFSSYGIRDLVIDDGFGEVFNFGEGSRTRNKGICVSPTGCYRVTTDTIDGGRSVHFASYSSSSNSFADDYICDPVDICGNLFDSSNPKREGLNHLTQITVPDLKVLEDPTSSKFKALCWIMNQDELFETYSICDGTLLQRYVLTLFYFDQGMSKNLDKLVSKPTCEWPGITCDTTHLFVERIILPGSGLEGTFTTEIGLLTRLKVLDLSNNDLYGTIDPTKLPHLPYLEVFNVTDNKFVGDLSKEFFQYPQLRVLGLAKNAFVGTIPKDVRCSETIKSINLARNLFQGTIPDYLTACGDLEFIDLSRNNFIGVIPRSIGTMSNLEVINLHQNRLSGSIPLEIFELSHLRVLMLRSNRLIGNIPSEVKNLQNATTITINHNLLKGSLPTELASLKNLEFLHLHQNRLYGTFPSMSFKNIASNTFIADCGDPMFLLAERLECETCTMCCNSEGFCQRSTTWEISIWTLLVLVAFLTPTLWVGILFIKKMRTSLDAKRDPSSLYSAESVYCLIFADDVLAKSMYLLTAIVQISLYFVYMRASDVSTEDTDWKFSIRCPHNTFECKQTNQTGIFGWILFVVVNTFFLGSDIIMSVMQIQAGVALAEVGLLVSGFTLFGLTAPAVFVSYVYNMASAMKNTDLITNSVILLFINDLDEKLMDLLLMLRPEWTTRKIEEVQKAMSNRYPKIPEEISEIEEDPAETAKKLSSSRYQSGLKMLGFTDDF